MPATIINLVLSYKYYKELLLFNPSVILVLLPLTLFEYSVYIIITNVLLTVSRKQLIIVILLDVTIKH